MGTALATLSDAQLAGVTLRVDDPRGADGYCRERPDSALAPEIVGFYELSAPPIGTRSSADLVWCCHCRKPNHLSGFVITNSTAARFTIGNTCGPKHYGLDFNLARQTFGRVRARQAAVARVEKLAAGAPLLLDAIADLLRAPALATIDAKRREIAKASSSAAAELDMAVRKGSPLREWVRVRDVAAEAQRDERSSAHAPPAEPIWTQEPHSLGPVRGTALVRQEGDTRDRLLALQRALKQAATNARDGTQGYTTPQLTGAAIAVEAAYRDVVASLAEARLAADFFAAAHLDALERWAAHRRGFTLRRVESGLEMGNRDSRPAFVRPIGKIELLDLPPLP